MEATKGRRSNSTIVFAGTPEETAPRIACFIGFAGQTRPNFWSRSKASNGPRVSTDFWVISGFAISGVGDGDRVGVGVVVGVVVILLWASTEEAVKVAAQNNPTEISKINVLRMGNKNLGQIIPLVVIRSQLCSPYSFDPQSLSSVDSIYLNRDRRHSEWLQ